MVARGLACDPTLQPLGPAEPAQYWLGRPSKDLMREQIKHHCQVQGFVVRTDVCDVRDPRSTWFTELEAGSQNVRDG